MRTHQIISADGQIEAHAELRTRKVVAKYRDRAPGRLDSDIVPAERAGSTYFVGVREVSAEEGLRVFNRTGGARAARGRTETR